MILKISMIILGIISVCIGIFLAIHLLNLINIPPENAGNPDPDEQKLTEKDYKRIAIMTLCTIGSLVLFFGGFYWIYLWFVDRGN